MAPLASTLEAMANSAIGAALHAQTHLHHLEHHVHHHRFSGSPVGYAGLAAAAAASWIGVPGPGEPLLIAAGILAAKNKLDITSVVVVGGVSATAGGVGGWLFGIKAGRRLLGLKGPLYNFRKAAVARGDAVFRRYPVLAVVLTPSWIAGIHHVRSSIYLPVNAIAALAWAVGIGLGSYYVGPPVLDIVADAGTAIGVAFVVLVLGVVVEEVIRRRRSRRRRAARQDPD
jgi:membrane protein DedA with SNARE-associated domain